MARGARVIGTARPESHAFVSGLGATPVSYGPGLVARLRALGVARVDLALDVAGAGSLDELVTITGEAATVVTLADFTGPGRGVRLSRGQYAGEADGRHGLALAAALSRQGRFRVPVQETVPAARAAAAHAAAARRPRQGKIVLDLAGLPGAG
ncbi:zinc-binding dehydrogenase [Streptomyces sp. NPDC001153]